jgi:hypothetical protein
VTRLVTIELRLTGFLNQPLWRFYEHIFGPFVKTTFWFLPLAFSTIALGDHAQGGQRGVRALSAVAQTPITTCTTITTSGSYQVIKPISGNNCLTVTAGSVSVSCAAGATIGNVASNQSQPAVNISNNASVTLTGCTVQVAGTSQTLITSPVSAIISTVTLTGDTVVGGETYLQSSATTINGGTYETLQVNGGSATFNNNPSFTASPIADTSRTLFGSTTEECCSRIQAL